MNDKLNYLYSFIASARPQTPEPAFLPFHRQSLRAVLTEKAYSPIHQQEHVARTRTETFKPYNVTHLFIPPQLSSAYFAFAITLKEKFMQIE